MPRKAKETSFKYPEHLSEHSINNIKDKFGNWRTKRLADKYKITEEEVERIANE